MAVKTVQATINGQTYTLTLNSTSGKYEATVTAPSKSSYNQSGHYYGVTVKATDVAGNITTKDAAEAVTVGSDGSFNKALTLAEGTNTIIVVAKDGAGKTTTVTRTVTLNTVAPTIKSVTITPNPVDCGKTFVISVEVTN